MLRCAVEIICWNQLLRLSVEFICWDQLRRTRNETETDFPIGGLLHRLIPLNLRFPIPYRKSDSPKPLQKHECFHLLCVPQTGFWNSPSVLEIQGLNPLYVGRRKKGWLAQRKKPLHGWQSPEHVNWWTRDRQRQLKLDSRLVGGRGGANTPTPPFSSKV